MFVSATGLYAFSIASPMATAGKTGGGEDTPEDHQHVEPHVGVSPIGNTPPTELDAEMLRLVGGLPKGHFVTLDSHPLERLLSYP